MQREENANGPSIGEPAPCFESSIGQDRVTLKDFKGNWLILLSHPEDLAAVFNTRTINYLLCKRRVRVICLVRETVSAAAKSENFLKKYIRNHRMTTIADAEGKAAGSYGISATGSKGVFVIDPAGVLRMKLYFSAETERNFYEILKLLDALQAADKQRAEQAKCRGWKGRLGITIRRKALTEPD